MLPFTITIQDGVPVSDQVFRAVRKAVLTGQLVPGDGFPSVRSLSQELRMSPTTAHKVVAQLKDLGFLASRPGIGMVVTQPEMPTREERMKHIEPLCRALVNEAAQLNLNLEDIIEALRTAAERNGDSTPRTEANND
ncbi:MAG: DNA-binding transcriptional regulator YhcF (GntR family) [Limisphaerales bacterium]|jgi:GntR family transcriptional regulator